MRIKLFLFFGGYGSFSARSLIIDFYGFFDELIQGVGPIGGCFDDNLLESLKKKFLSVTSSFLNLSVLPAQSLFFSFNLSFSHSNSPLSLSLIYFSQSILLSPYFFSILVQSLLLPLLIGFACVCVYVCVWSFWWGL